MNARVMEHEQAIKNMMAERYLLGELSESERDSYEEHLFDCSVCFEQVKAGTEFVSYLKQIGVDEPAYVTQPRWRQFLARVPHSYPTLALAVILLCVAGTSVYQGTMIRRMRSPQVVDVVTVTPEARGTSKTVTASHNGMFELRAVFPLRPELKFYQARVVDSSETEIASIPVGEPRSNELQLRFNAGMFRNGKYVLIIQANDQSKGSTEVVNRYPFELQLQD